MSITAVKSTFAACTEQQMTILSSQTVALSLSEETIAHPITNVPHSQNTTRLAGGTGAGVPKRIHTL